MTVKHPLSVTHPELGKEAVGWDPSQFSHGSNVIQLWNCAKGHKWTAKIKVRSQGNGCPICAGKKVLAGFNDLSTTHPLLSLEAWGWDPTTVTHGSDFKKVWRCELGHIWTASISNRCAGKGCPICSGRQILSGFNDLAILRPDLARQAWDWDPTTVTLNSNTKKAWKCDEGHSWEAPVSSRSSGKGCPFCSSNRVLAGFNDLATLNPKLASEAFQWDPSSVTRSSNTRQSWKCALGHVWQSTVNKRNAGNGCPICAGQQVLKGFNDLATTNPELAPQANGWDPTKVTRSSNSKKLWKCDLAHSWETAVSARTRGSNCPICAGQRVLAGFNDLGTLLPELAKEAFEWDPATVTPGTNAIKDWMCSLNHRFRTAVSSRSAGSGCPYCTGQKVLLGFNDLKTVHPALANQAFRWDPTTVTAGSGTKREWICESGHRWKTSVVDRSHGSGCPSCAAFGFDPNRDGWLYLLSHRDWRMLQIGITNSPQTRMQKHRRIGWELIELRGPMDGLIAREWETSILRMLKRHGAKLAPEEIAGKFDGFTEAWLTGSYEAKSLRDLMDAVQNDEDK